MENQTVMESMYGPMAINTLADGNMGNDMVQDAFPGQMGLFSLVHLSIMSPAGKVFMSVQMEPVFQEFGKKECRMDLEF